MVYLVVVALVWGGCVSKSHRMAPDIVPVVVDTVRVDYFGRCGFQGETSPSIDERAAKSVVVGNTIAPAPWTKPSIASWFASLDAMIHRVRYHDNAYEEHWKYIPSDRRLGADVLHEEAGTLAEGLQELVYVAGTWVTNDALHSKWGVSQGFDQFDEEFG